MWPLPPGYWLLGGAIGVAIFVALVIGPAVPLLIELAQTGANSHQIWLTSGTVISLALFDEGWALSAFYALMATLMGANVALLLAYWRTRRFAGSGTTAVTGSVGAFVAALGFGCASCGTLFLSMLLGSGSAAALASAPFADELTYGLRTAGIVLLTLSLVRLLRHLKDPLTCPA